MSLINCGLHGAPAARAIRNLDGMSPIVLTLDNMSTYIVGVPVMEVQLKKMQLPNVNSSFKEIILCDF